MKYIFAVIIVVFILGGAVIGVSNFHARADEQVNSAYAVAIPSILAQAAVDEDKQKMCLNGRPYYGCCSGRGGIKEIKNTQVLCNNDTLSPSCSTHLNGCCRGHEGVGEVQSDGTVMCKSGKPSPSCQCERQG
jgi:hypothetical protein